MKSASGRWVLDRALMQAGKPTQIPPNYVMKGVLWLI